MTSPHSNRKAKKNLLIKPLALAALMTGGLLQPLTLPAFAANAGEKISNTATATYKDDDGNTFDTESNTVEITIKEIAGITVEPAGVDDLNGGSFEAGDELDFKFTVTNVGNDSTGIKIPDVGDLLAPTNFNPALRGIETADSMTENQKVAFVRDFFEKNN